MPVMQTYAPPLLHVSHTLLWNINEACLRVSCSFASRGRVRAFSRLPRTAKLGALARNTIAIVRDLIKRFVRGETRNSASRRSFIASTRVNRFSYDPFSHRVPYEFSAETIDRIHAGRKLEEVTLICFPLGMPERISVIKRPSASCN